MAKIKLTLPAKFIFSTELEVRISDVNYVGHLGNEAVLTLANEARVRFLKQYNYSERNVEGVGLIMTDAAIEYKNEAWQGDRLMVEIAVADVSRMGFDLDYRISNIQSLKVIAFLRTGMIFFNYETRKMAGVPQEFSAKFALI